MLMNCTRSSSPLIFRERLLIQHLGIISEHLIGAFEYYLRKRGSKSDTTMTQYSNIWHPPLLFVDLSNHCGIQTKCHYMGLFFLAQNTGPLKSPLQKQGRSGGAISWTSDQLSAGDVEHDMGDTTKLVSLAQES